MKVVILGVQKAWGYNEKDEYVFGVPAYTVQMVEPITVNGELYISTIPKVAGINEVELI